MKKIRCFLSVLFFQLCLYTYSQSLVVNDKRIDYDVTNDGEKGYMVHLDMNVKGMKDKECKLYLLFEDIDGNRILSGNGKHLNKQKRFTPPHANSHYSDFKVFVPYSKCSSKDYYLKARVKGANSNDYITGYQYIHVILDNDVVAVKKTKNKKDKSGIRKKKVELGNGYEIWYYDGDRAVKTYKKETCLICRGTKICKICNGAGGRWGRAYGGMYYPCTGCFQTGVCNYCFGKGYQETVTVYDGAGHATLYTSQGVFYGSGGSSIGSSSETSSSSSGSESRGKKAEYYDIIHYEPNYTGLNNEKWCNECGKGGPAHSHQRIRTN